MKKLLQLRRKLKKLANPQRAKLLQRYFKTGKGEYGEGDIFLGLRVPVCRKLAIKFRNLSFPEITKLLRSKFHEERLIALLILVRGFKKGSETERKKIFEFYLKNTDRVNNWDLVDLSSHEIAGGYLLSRLGSAHSLNDLSKPSGNTHLLLKVKSNSSAAKSCLKNSKKTVKSSFREESRPNKILFVLAKSKNIWERRIACISTFEFIRNNHFTTSLRLAEMLINDEHALMHKAVGWMLREMGKKNPELEISFLNKHYKEMPRTMLRYAIEKFPEKLRREFLEK